MEDREFAFPAKSESTRVRIGNGARRTFDEFVQSIGRYSEVVHLVDESVARHFADDLPTASCDVIVQKGGESEKTFAAVEALIARLSSRGIARDSLLCVWGGGSLCDLGAFTAAVYLRGIDCVLCPTSLVAMVDAAIGGKCGVDHAVQKNVIGVIRQPKGVLIDPDFLASLGRDGMREGIVEAAKGAAMFDADFFARIEDGVDRILARSEELIAALVRDAVLLKLRVVAEDQTDVGQRMFLNFGHTIGHAIESVSRFSVSHGAAVAAGMPIEIEIAQKGGGERIGSLMRRLGYVVGPAMKRLKTADLWPYVMLDKKRSGGRVRMAVPETIGRGTVIFIDEADCARVLG